MMKVKNCETFSHDVDQSSVPKPVRKLYIAIYACNTSVFKTVKTNQFQRIFKN